MTLEEAIKGNEAFQKHLVKIELPLTAEFVGMGIEALKRFMELRHAGIIGAYKLLPGESDKV